MMMVQTVKIGGTRIYIPEKDQEWILEKTREVLESAILTEGKFCRELESDISKYLGVKHVIATNSGTGALEVMLRSLNIRGEVIVTPETFSATIYAILRAGCRPVFADVGSDMALNPDRVKEKMTNKTGAILTVHIGGHISEGTQVLAELAEKKGIPLVEDSAQAMGSKLGGVSAGNFGRGSGFSLFPTKVMGSAEGGFFVTNDSKAAEDAQLYKDQGKKVGNLCTVQGYNWRMSEHTAIVALTQLRRLDQFISRREEIASQYYSMVRSESLREKMTEMYVSPRARPNWYKFVAFLSTKIEREQLKARLKERSIALSGEVYEVPCHTQPAFAELGYKEGDFPVAEKISKAHVCFPLMANLTDAQVQYFGEAIRSCI
jgi:perosamine synthetase